jgi:hypothetical protein
MKIKNSEKGQAIILLTAGIITLLGFAALAIDGGRLYSERRKIQGVADTTAMTGALYLAHYDGTVDATAWDEAKQEARDRAAENGYPSGQVTVDIIEDAGFFVVTATINSDVDPVLAQLVYGGNFNVAAKSIARVENNNIPPPFALGQAFFAMNTEACRALDLIGSNTLTVTGSGLFSNSDCCAAKDAINAQGNASIDITGDLSSAGCVSIEGAASSSYNAINEGVPQYDIPTLSEPDCSGLFPQSVSGDPIVPGIYSGISVTGGNTINMDPGLYCLDGDFSITSGTIIGHGVTIFMRSGKVNINSGANELYAPQAGEADDASGQSWDGMLFFQAYGNTSNFFLNGNNDSDYIGTIFVPDGHCTLNGGGDSAGYDTQFVCDTIDVSGNADIFLNFDDTNKYVPPPPTTISLVE